MSLQPVKRAVHGAWIRALAKAANTPAVFVADALSRALADRPTRLLDTRRVSYCDRTGRIPVDAGRFAPDRRRAVMLAFGQSNIANEGAPDALFAPGPGVFNFNFFDGLCYVARDPLLGASMNRGNVATRLGERLVRRGVYDQVLLVPIACGGTYAADWVPGGEMYPRLAVALHRLRRCGIAVTHALWQQGEAEASDAAADGAAWARNFAAMLAALRRAGMTAPVYVAQSTRCCGPPNERIRSAQRAVVDPGAGVLAGPDTDAIGPERRWDGCHFSAAGLHEAADLWDRAIAAP